MKLLLFDIDGTLLHSNGTGRAAIERALSDLCGRRIATDQVTFSGKTDPQIIRQILATNGLDQTALLDEALTAYEDAALHALDADAIAPLPGTTELLTHLNTLDQVQLALLTGNLETMAYHKLAAVGLDHYFAFGAFGSDHADRYQLPPVALRRAKAHTGHSFEGKDVIIVGDTEHDIRCGCTIGAFSVGVCTGRYSRYDLLPHNPDVLLDDLSDIDRFVQQVLGPSS